MSDLISRQAVEDLIMETDPYWWEGMTRAIFEGVKRLPAIDAVPVVRCKDCKWWREETDHTCRKWGGASPRKANGYCDDGERSEE